MLSKFTTAAVAATLSLAASAVMAGAGEYAFEPANPEMKKGDDVTLVTLVREGAEVDVVHPRRVLLRRYEGDEVDDRTVKLSPGKIQRTGVKSDPAERPRSMSQSRLPAPSSSTSAGGR